jgi:hypothetical protein
MVKGPHALTRRPVGGGDDLSTLALFAFRSSNAGTLAGERTIDAAPMSASCPGS